VASRARAAKPIKQPAVRRVRRTQSAAQILEAASRLLSRRGTLNVSVNEIAAESGLNSALISYHFGSKEGMLLALVKRDATVALAQLEQLVNSDLSPAEKIRLHVHGVIETYAKQPYLNRLLHLLLDVQHRRSAKDLAKFFSEPLVALESRIIDEGVRLGQFKPIEPLLFHLLTIGMCDILFYGRASLEFVFNTPRVTPELRFQYAEYATAALLALLRGAALPVGPLPHLKRRAA